MLSLKQSISATQVATELGSWQANELFMIPLAEIDCKLCSSETNEGLA